ncbi:MAG: NAD(P)/FAD-dependent oxidoreductase [Bacteroidia bacterium]
MQKKNKAIIVGGGLAGSLLSLELLQRGWQITLWDDGAPAAGSRVAAGLFNVITGRFGAKSWMADTLLGHLRNWLEQDTQLPLRQFIHDIPIYRPFKTIEEYNKWQGRFADPEYASIVKVQEKAYRPDVINNELGGIWIKPCGWVDVAGLTAYIRGVVEEHPQGVLKTKKLDYEKITLENKKVQIVDSEDEFDHIIFCEGYRIRSNPFFPDIRIIPNKGELLEIYAPALKLDFALSRKVYLVPRGEDRYILGSTYANQFDDLLPTEEGKQNILENLLLAADFEFEIIHHKAGIRPTTPDRRPILGSHSEHGNVHVLAGFGTKGMLQGPYCTSLMADYLENPQANPLPEVMRINRFKKKKPV